MVLRGALFPPDVEDPVIRRVLFASPACYLDDANGASIATRAILETLARWGFSVEVLCGSLLGLRGEIDLPSALAARGMSFDVRGGEAWEVGAFGTRPLTPPHLRLRVAGVAITILIGPTQPHAVTEEDEREFLRLFEDIWSRHRPDVVISYGGGPVTREVFRRAKARGAATVFALHNLRYRDPAPFADVDAVVVASRYAAEHYRASLGLECTILPNLVDWRRVLAPDRRPTYIVFVNPTIEKGVAVFARVADELGRLRPDIPFLVVESKGTEQDVAACGLDLRAFGNVFFHEHTSDPRRFWRMARLCLLPSLVAENQPLVAIEAMINGVPVIGSDRGGIPEVLGGAGLIREVPDRLSSDSLILPTADEVHHWVKTIRALWDSPEDYTRRREKVLIEADRWAPDALEPAYERFFAKLITDGKAFPGEASPS